MRPRNPAIPGRQGVREPLNWDWQSRSVTIAALETPVDSGVFSLGSMGLLDRAPVNAASDLLAVYFALDLNPAVFDPDVATLSVTPFLYLRIAAGQQWPQRIEVPRGLGSSAGTGVPRDRGGYFTVPTAPGLAMSLLVEQTAGDLVGTFPVWVGYATMPRAAAAYAPEQPGAQPLVTAAMPVRVR